MVTTTGIFRMSLDFLIGFLLMSCQGTNSGSHRARNAGVPKQNPPAGETRFVRPAANQEFAAGDPIMLEIEVRNASAGVDSIEVFLGGRKSTVLLQEPYRTELRDGNQSTGKLEIRTVTWYADRSKETRQAYVTILADKAPREIGYRIVKTYPHDVGAYTQGLEYKDGYLYEGTGQYNESSLRKVDLESGEPVRLLNLPGDIFGEGITVFGGKIYQLTYKSQVGFVYDKESFRRLQKVYYQNKEGWGLTNNGEQLIMSDGTNAIYFMDPEYFSELRRIEVYDDKGPVMRLNELEYIEGKIFANIYGSDEIVVIDPATGKVTGRLDMKGLLSRSDRTARTDVFNGIAWIRGTDKILVTGKYWPKLFEVELEGGY